MADQEETSVVSEADQPEPKPQNKVSPQQRLQNRFKTFAAAYKSKKKLTVPLTIIALIGLILLVPLTRYPVLGLAIRKNVALHIVDNVTGKPVSGAAVSVGGSSAVTDGEGHAELRRVKVGKQKARIEKKYYQTAETSIFVPLGSPDTPDLKLEATGRQVPVAVTNKINGKPVAQATMLIADGEFKTDDEGKAVIVVSADQSELDVVIKQDGFNELTAKVQIVEQEDERNIFALVPAGKIYFLSKRTGKIDVVKTDLDGGNRQTVLAGTGKEEEGGTILLASRDWKYLALKSRREGDKAKLYLINTADDKLSVMDEGDANFTVSGWLNEHFIYSVTRNKKLWEDKLTALKSFNAKTQQLKTLDETAAQGNANSYAREVLDNIYIQDDSLIYTKRWVASYSNVYFDKRANIMSVKADGQQKKSLKDFVQGDAGRYLGIAARVYEPGEVYFAIYGNSDSTEYYEYEDGSVKAVKDVSDETFNRSYPTFLVSPSGKLTFWSDARDGKSTLILGDAGGNDEKEIASLTDYVAYGWYTDNYVLMSKNGSELYIRAAGSESPTLKISDYHKPNYDFSGYGYGYGGF